MDELMQIFTNIKILFKATNDYELPEILVPLVGLCIINGVLLITLIVCFLSWSFGIGLLRFIIIVAILDVAVYKLRLEKKAIKYKQ